MSVLDGFESRLRRRSPTLWRMYETFSERNVPFMAGSVAFTAFMSLVPLFALLYLLLAVLGDPALVDQIVGATESFLPQQGQDLLARSLRNQSGAAGSSVISAVVLVWGVLRLFLNLDTAFLEIYYADPDESFVSKLVDSAVALGGLAVAVGAVVAAGAAVTFVDWIPYVQFVAPVLLVVGLTVAFLPIYYFFPNVDTTARDALPGAFVAAVGWGLLQSLFQVYLSVSSSTTSGILGAVIIVLTYLYFAALVVLVGAVVNAVLSDHVGPLDVGDDHDAGAPYDVA